MADGQTLLRRVDKRVAHYLADRRKITRAEFRAALEHNLAYEASHVSPCEARARV